MAHGAPARGGRLERLAPQEGDAAHLAWIIGAAADDPAGVAASLLAEFASVGGVLAASTRRIRRLTAGHGDVAGEIARFNAAVLHVLASRISARPLLTCWSSLVEYLRFQLSFSSEECFRILHLDAANFLVHDELGSRGSATSAPVSIRAIMDHAMELGSASLILVHNHPSGDPRPSAADLELTRRVVASARSLDIEIIDHLIVGTSGIYSFRKAGRLT